MYLRKWLSVGSLISIFFLGGCVNTGKMNFENNMNYRIDKGKPSIEKLVEVRANRNNYLGKNIINIDDVKIVRYHFKFKGNPKLEPCYYYVDVNYKTKRLLSWGYDEKGDERACVN